MKKTRAAWLVMKCGTAAITVSLILFVLCFTHAVAAGVCETEFDQLMPADRPLPYGKLGRGATDVLGGPHELFAYMTNYAILGSYNGAYTDGFYGSVSGAVAGYVSGFFPGVYHMVKRMSAGCLDMLTFWRPDFRPVSKPTHALRGLGSGPSDYFDKEPYWYMGPER
ncbi:MAG: hypothetical protein ACP5M0_12835 [Desulfomonilaceae bacterium]